MEWEHIALFATPIITAVGLWISNVISNRPAQEKTKIDRFEKVLGALENQYDRSEARVKECEKRVRECEDRYARACEENRELRRKIKDLRYVLNKLKEGGDKE